MNEAIRLTELIKSAWPVAGRMLSAKGVGASFPQGIPFQAAEAKGAELNATMGQVTDGDGSPLPLQALKSLIPTLDQSWAFLYSPQAGHTPLREAWQKRQRRIASVPADHHSSLPIVTHGLTQGIVALATIFADENTDIIIPAPFWGNYTLIFKHNANATISPYPSFINNTFNIDGLEESLSQAGERAVVILNFPANPSGYSPTQEEADRIVDIVTNHPRDLVVIFDDAYAGMVWEKSAISDSLYWRVAALADPNRLFPVKLDGITKELIFFSSRIGFVTHPLQGEAEEALASKIKMVMRAGSGAPPGPSQAMVYAALQNPALEDQIESTKLLLFERYQELKSSVHLLEENPRITVRPFNSGCFATFEIDPSIDAAALRVRLLREYGTGVVHLLGTNAIRIAYCSTKQSDLPKIISRIDTAVRAS
jgi:aspartate/methionine/tyrosine aminotransferase